MIVHSTRFDHICASKNTQLIPEFTINTVKEEVNVKGKGKVARVL